ncbi:MAG: hypothetical protein LRY73_18850 [Bacillus sp. (in: Bacteria)]|nr:hypothetical protein [Bacillus sp. (in: firmicutes)]
MKNLTKKPQYYDGSGKQTNSLDMKQLNTDIILKPDEVKQHLQYPCFPHLHKK